MSKPCKPGYCSKALIDWMKRTIFFLYSEQAKLGVGLFCNFNNQHYFFKLSNTIQSKEIKQKYLNKLKLKNQAQLNCLDLSSNGLSHLVW